MPSIRLYTRDRDTQEIKFLDIDTQTWALVVITNEHHHIHEGLAYDITGTATLNAGQVYRYTITTPNSDWLDHFRFHIHGEAEGSITLFENPTISVAGTTVEPISRNRDNLQAAGTVVRHTPTTTDNGTQIYYATFGSGREAGALTAGEEWILARNQDYLFVITSDAAGNEISWEIFFYEHSATELH